MEKTPHSSALIAGRVAIGAILRTMTLTKDESPMADLPYSAAVTLLVVLLMFATAANVGLARKRHNVIAPATSGHPMFERAYRIQMNTLEWAVMTLPCLWICAVFVGDVWAAGLGGVWLVGRCGYAFAYQRDPARRGPGFMLGALAFGALGLAAGGGVLFRLFGG